MDQMNNVSSLSNAYFSVYSVDLQTHQCSAVKVVDAFYQVVKNCHKAEVVVNAFLTTCVREEDIEKMRAFTDLSTLAQRLNENDTTVQEFHGAFSPWEWCRASWIAAGRDKKGKVRNVLFTVEDITAAVNERKQYEQELKASRAAAEAASKAKTDFLFSMSHDIRTPMNAIIGYAELMDRHFDEPEKCRDYLNKIKKSSSVLLSLINNVLEMARIESGKLVLEEKVCRITDLADEITSVYGELMKQKGIEFTIHADVRTEYYYADQVKLSEIFLNIVSNAYKFTGKGGKIAIAIRQLEDEKPGYIRLQTMVSDTGIGMAEEFLPRIFDEFSREHTSTENKIEGTGLGMPIVKKLVEFMNGTIEVDSRPQKGTTFTVTIPHRIAQPDEIERKQAVPVNPEKYAGKRILLAEDNELNTEIATEILTRYGLLVEHAEDGRICTEMLSKAPAGYYDVILMDIQMPNLDGYGAAKQIRSLKDRAKAEIPIIAMTANAFEEDRQNALAAGMNGHLAKPIQISRLMETLNEVFNPEAASV